MQDHRLRDPVNPVLMHFISPPTNPNLLFAKKIVTLARSLTVPDTNFGTTPLPFARFLESVV